MSAQISTQKQLREEFWHNHPQYTRRGQTKQNDYACGIRMAWCDFVESIRRNGDISEALASRATL